MRRVGRGIGRANARPMTCPPFASEMVRVGTARRRTFAHPTAPCNTSRHTTVILRSRALERRLEGWPQALVAHPSRLAVKNGEHLRMTAACAGDRLAGRLPMVKRRPRKPAYPVDSHELHQSRTRSPPGPRSRAPSASSPRRTGSRPRSAWRRWRKAATPSTPAVATAFTLQVVEPHLNGPGGDVPVIVYDVQARQDRSDLRPGPGAGRRHHRALPRRTRSRLDARHRPSRGLRPRHVRHLDAAAARLRHDAARRRACARDRLCPERLSAGRARQRDHRHRRGAVPRALADLGGGLSAGRQGAGARHAVHQPEARRDLCAHPARSRERAAATASRRSNARARPGRRASSPKRSTASAARRRSWTRPARAIAACSPADDMARLAGDASRRRSPTTTAATRVLQGRALERRGW